MHGGSWNCGGMFGDEIKKTAAGPIVIAIPGDAAGIDHERTFAGAVTIGAGSPAGARLQPSSGANDPATLRIQGALSFQAGAIFRCKLDSDQAKANQVMAAGVSIDGAAQFNLSIVGREMLKPGTVLTSSAILLPPR